MDTVDQFRVAVEELAEATNQCASSISQMLDQILSSVSSFQDMMDDLMGLLEKIDLADLENRKRKKQFALHNLFYCYACGYFYRRLPISRIKERGPPYDKI